MKKITKSTRIKSQLTSRQNVKRPLNQLQKFIENLRTRQIFIRSLIGHKFYNRIERIRSLFTSNLTTRFNYTQHHING